MSIPKTIYQLKVTLVDSKPPIWRRVLVPETVTLSQLHVILQIVMGWTDSHLHMFTVNGQIYGDPEDDETGDLGTKDESRYRLNQFVNKAGFKFRYEYDFGDSWEHSLLVEEILPAKKGERYPLCSAGKRACPPEDVGGIGGYINFLEALSNPKHHEHEEYLEWIGGKFDPDRFDLDEVNYYLHHRRRRREAYEQDYYQIPKVDNGNFSKIIAWAQGLTKEQLGLLDSLAVRRDMGSFLSYLIENRTVGTQSTGNLPLKAVHAICALFVHPPKLEDSIGDHHYHVRSEDDVWPLFYVHTLANASGLVAGGPARIWKVTEDGQIYSQLPSPIQVVFLLHCWWYMVDWTIAFPFTGFRNGLPASFNQKTLSCLLELPVGKSSSYATFADHLIQESGLVWPIADQVSARNILHSAVEHVVIDSLVRFGVLECEYGTKITGGYSSRELTDIRLISTGKGMLELLE